MHQNGPPRFGLFRRALAIRRAAGRLRLRRPLRLSKGKHYFFDASFNRPRLCARIRPSIGFATSLDLGLGADSCDRFRVRCARILKKKVLRRARGRPRRRLLRGFRRAEVSPSPLKLGLGAIRATGSAFGGRGSRRRIDQVLARPPLASRFARRVSTWRALPDACLCLFRRGVAIRRRAARERPSRGPRRGSPWGARRLSS